MSLVWPADREEVSNEMDLLGNKMAGYCHLLSVIRMNLQRRIVLSCSVTKDLLLKFLICFWVFFSLALFFVLQKVWNFNWISERQLSIDVIKSVVYLELVLKASYFNKYFLELLYFFLQKKSMGWVFLITHEQNLDFLF